MIIIVLLILNTIQESKRIFNVKINHRKSINRLSSIYKRRV